MSKSKSHRSFSRRLVVVAATAASAVVLAACGGNDSGSHTAHRSPSPSASSPSASAGAHNAADVAFAKGMIPHHRQAVEMADLAAGRASSSQVKELAAKIKQAQDPEIKTMSGWLTAWGEQVPEEMPGMDHSEHSGSSGHSGMPGMDHSGMPGMMSAKAMAALKKKSGRAFDTAFMEMMVGHHRGAVKMAGTEKEKGAYGPAKTLADAVIKAQEAEISRMNRLLGRP
ncbi:DUF305 domain-containing protein [Streptomyces platensis]|uniref:DUF305 domain-containing protein n=1 Tax=Streptomyces platensis TaxID=58346 RepID=A0AAE6NIL8_STRPT|nr:DUF305 domain-containing protein [Streptomyces platensis]OSY37775.1 hypothetical protein BG653_06324 [Streptomyces platensis]QEV53799.1 DUF305 domain-containing protein [Streptomyces platensis]